jgi:autotransporter translocation and assembly factor TamB
VGGSIAGPFEIGWRGGVVDFRGTWSGRYLEHDLEGVQADLAWSPEKLEVRSASGRLQEGRFVVALEQRGAALHGRLDLDGIDLRAWRADLPPSRLAGRVEFGRAAAGDTLDLRAVLAPSSLAGCALARARAHVGLIGAQQLWHEIYLETGTGSALAAGSRRGSQLELDWELDAADVAAFLVPLGLQELHGAARLQGRCAGRLDSLSCTAAGEFATLRYGGLEAGGGAVELQAALLTPVPSVVLSVRGDSLRLGERRLGRFTGNMAYDGVELHLRRAEVASADTLLALAASLRPEARDWNGELRRTTRMRLHTALLQIGGQEFRVEEPATLRWRPGAVQVDSLRLLARGGGARLDGGFDLDNARIDARTEIQSFDLGFLARLAQVRPRVAGTGTGWIELHGWLDATQIDSRLVVLAGNYNDLEFDSLQVDLQSEAFGTSVRAASLHTPMGGIRASGRLGYLPSLQRWLQGRSGSRAPQELARAPLEASLRVDALALEPFWRALRGIQAPSAWGARLSAACDLSGSIEAPVVTIRGVARAAHLGGAIDADSLAFACRYAGSTLDVSSLWVEAAGARLRAEGRLPVRWQLASRPRLDGAGDLLADLTLERSSFAVVPRFIALFEPAPQGVPPGWVQGTLHIEGTPDAPELQGQLRVQGAGFTLADLEEVYHDVHATGTFQEDTLELVELRGRSGKDGWVRGKGWVRFARLRVRDYALAFEADMVPVYSVPDIEALVGGRIEVTAARLDDGPVPEFKGSLKIHQAEITREFTAGPEAGSALLESTDRPEWLADVAIEAPARVWVRNSNADAELGGNVQIIRTTAGLDVQGRATTRRGHYSAYLERFEITRGELDFSRHPGWEPELDIEAQRGRVNERIYVHLTGRPSEPRLVFTSDGRGSSEELQHILMADVRNDPANVATTVVENVLDDVGYLDSITIDPATPRGEPVAAGQQAPLISAYNVSAGYAVSDRVFVTYTRGLNQSDLNQRVAIELDVLRGLLLASSWEIRYIPSPEFLSDAAQNAFNVDVKFRHEY